MKPIKFLLFLILSSFITSCYDDFSSKELRANFTETQIRDLKLVSEFFKDQICRNDTLDFKSCFNNFLPQLLNDGLYSVKKNIKFDEQLKTYNSFESNVFDEIWTFCKSRENDKYFLSVCANIDGKYLNFINDVSLKYDFLKKYHNALIQSGDFDYGFYLEQELYKNKIELNDPNLMTIISIHYLTLNDGEKRNRKE